MVPFYYAGQNFLFQSTAMLLLIVGGGFLISILNRLFYKTIKNPRLYYLTGIIGTPIHELSHALLCIIFRHKITEMKLFQIDEGTGCLGYVRHEYNKRNPYHLLGGFFIGIAPILVGSGVIIFLLWLLLPALFTQYTNIASVLLGDQTASIITTGVGQMIEKFFISATNPLWWLFIVIGGMIAHHMTLSEADIKSGIVGAIIFFVVLFLINLITAFINLDAAVSLGEIYFSGILYLFFTLFMSVIVSSAVLLLALLFKGASFGLKKLSLKKAGI